MERHLFSAVASAVLLAASVSAHAATETSNFAVSVSLTSVCAATNSGATTLDFGSYTAFGNTHTTNPTVALTFKCTRGMAVPTFSFDAALGGNNGAVGGLNYTLAAAAAVTTAGTAAAPGVAGTDAVHTVTVTGTMASGQAGDAAAAVTQTRVLTITY